MANPGTLYLRTASGYLRTGAGRLAIKTAVPCNNQVQSGGQGTTRTEHALGAASGWVNISYDMGGRDDAMDVYHDGALVASTNGPTGPVGKLSWYYQAGGGVPQTCEVVMSGPEDQTSWTYQLDCPSSTQDGNPFPNGRP